MMENLVDHVAKILWGRRRVRGRYAGIELDPWESETDGLRDDVRDEARLAIDVVLEAVAFQLESRSGNSLYKSAWRAAAKVVRSWKNLNNARPILNDNPTQISSSLAPTLGDVSPGVKAGA